MKKNLVIINTNKKNDICPLIYFFNELINQGTRLAFYTTNKKLAAQCKERGWSIKKLACAIKPEASQSRNILFLLLLPLIIPVSLIFTVYIKRKYNDPTLLCFDWPEKIVLTLTAKICKIKCIWFESPGEELNLKNFLASSSKRLTSGWATIISLSEYTKNNLRNLGFKRKINLIPAGIRPGHFSRQDNIFNKLAETEAEKNKKKFFTIGTIAALNDNQQLEKLFSAIKKSLTVIPNLQLIIIGNGEEKKKLKWTVKKMGISPIVWFVGEQAILKKWIDNFDIYISVVKHIGLNDLFSTIQVAASGIPIIGPSNIGLEDVVSNKKEGFLVDINDNEILTQSIIKLQQNKTLRRQISQTLKNKIDNNNSISKMTKQFKKICDTN